MSTTAINLENAKTYGKVIAHPARLRIVELLVERGEMSPKELSDALGILLGNTSYHVGSLQRLGAIELTRTQPVRGALEHFYQPTELGRLVVARAAAFVAE